MTGKSLLKRICFVASSLIIRMAAKLRGRKLYFYYLAPALGRRMEALASVCRSHGLPAEVVSGLSRESRLKLHRSPDLWVGFWGCVPVEHLPPRYVFWNTEPMLHSQWDDETDWQSLPGDEPRWHRSAAQRQVWKQAMVGALSIWGYRQNLEVFAQQLGKSFSFVPFGYAPYYEEVFRSVVGPQRPEPDIDVLFYGWMSQRRRLVLDELALRGMEVFIASDQNHLSGPDLERKMARSKIILCMFGYDDAHTHTPDFARLDFLLSNRLFVLHEKTSSEGRDNDFEAHVPVCAYEEIAETCAYYLNQPVLRAERAEAAQHWFKATYPLDSFLPFDSLRQMLRAA